MIRPLTRVTLSDAVSENDFTLLEESVSIWSVSQIGPAAWRWEVRETCAVPSIVGKMKPTPSARFPPQAGALSSRT